MDEYILLRLKSLEAILQAFMEVFAQTATPDQLRLLSEIGKEANRAYSLLPQPPAAKGE